MLPPVEFLVFTKLWPDTIVRVLFNSGFGVLRTVQPSQGPWLLWLRRDQRLLCINIVSAVESWDPRERGIIHAVLRPKLPFNNTITSDSDIQGKGT